MIEELHIRGLGVIEDTSLTLGPGLTVVTGETGAGKTLVVTALQLLLGARATSGLVRQGLAAATIEAVVRIPVRGGLDGWDEADADPEPEGTQSSAAPSRSEVESLWELAEDGALIVSREIPAAGRSRARVGGRLVPTSMLTALLSPHIEVHGQHEHVRLEQPGVQRRLLDAYGGPDHVRVLASYRNAYLRWSEAVRRERMLREGSLARSRRLAVLVAERDEIDAASLDPDRDGTLDQEIERLANADGLRSAIEAARAALGSGGALDGLGAAIAMLRRAPGGDPELLALAGRLSEMSRDLSESMADLASLADTIEADDARLDLLQSRKQEIQRLMRRYGASVADVLAHRSAVAREADELVALESDAVGVAAAVADAHAALLASASRLTGSRRSASERLANAVTEQLGELGLGHASLSVRLAPADPSPHGAESVEFLLAANPGEPPARLSDAASGGERSRVSLALEVVLAEGHGSGVLVFDEVDAGVGGSTALAVGEKLARLAAPGGPSRQVLCVTHLAQVAAFADAHHVVEKSVCDGRTVTSVRRLDESSRADVLSQMIGGEATAEAGLEHARALIDAARGRRAG